MAEKTPVTTTTTAGFVVPQLGCYGGVATATNNLVSDVDVHYPNVSGHITTRHYFGPSSSANDIDDGDTWPSGISGIVAVAWQAADIADDCVGATLTNAATGEITFAAENSNSEGWLWVIHGT